MSIWFKQFKEFANHYKLSGDDLIRSFKHLLDPETYELGESVLSKDDYYTIQERDIQRYFSAIGHIDTEQLKKLLYQRTKR
jgi:hypothetical protein